ncbi:uncharacterized protein [Venturia canescens]|uniref:uncharacterized protein isoform X2 n=1 Tax=Venturia canescens TaxID=32260 RepID=UPI001C9BF73E|nr:uncharacterized protein LOC122414095 isoform X2 [Venturia canescens]
MKRPTTAMDLLSIITVIVLVAAVMPHSTHARPSGLVSRQKRVSDQRVAELETLLALARMRGKLVTVPVGFGRVDPARIGRKRRSSEDSGLEKLQRLLEAVERQSESISSEESAEKLAYFWNDAEDEGSLELTDQLI